MKLVKSLALGALALATVASSQAAFTIRLTGATAFRQSVHAAIVNSLDNPQVGYVGTDLNGAGSATFVGTVKSGIGAPTALVGQVATIQVTWNGSAAGIQAVAQTKVNGSASLYPVSFLPPSVATGKVVAVTFGADTLGNQKATYTNADASSGTVGNGGYATTDQTDSEQADAVLSDVHQANTIFSSGLKTFYTGTTIAVGRANYDAGITSTKTFAALHEQAVGVVGFSWLRSNNPAIATSLTKFTSIDNWKAQLLLTVGSAPLSIFTGVASDSTYPVYITGRNADSGTRVTTLSEAGYVGDPFHYLVSVNATNITGVAPWGDDLVQTVFFPASTSGESSGGTLVNKIKLPVTGSNLTVVTTAGIADIVGKNAQAFEISWNGNSYSDEAVRNGAYTFWGYEQLGYLTTASSTTKSFLDFFAQSRINAPLPNGTAELSGVVSSTMKVQRADIGTVITGL